MKAEKLFKEVMKRILSTGTSQDDNKIVSMSLKLAAVYAAWKHDDSALTGFRFCIDAQEKKIANGE
jgi:tetratricopeptide repeat protein 19